MGNRVTVTWQGPTLEAKALLQAISPDDGESFSTEMKIEGESATLTIIVAEDSVRTLKATIDDILACLSAAESAIDEA